MAAPPSLRRERAAWAEQILLVGVDEAGRGPLAGPVVAAAVVFAPECRIIRGIRDSKLLPAGIRARLAVRIQSRALGFGVGAASAREIDRFNIRVATALAMQRALRRLLRRPSLDARPHRIVIDGLPLPEIGYAHEALIDGDALCHSIAAASILAKTVRDCLMQRLATHYPGYGWDTNVGYGTPEHQEALRLQGPCRHHRQSFAPVTQLHLF
ncbi:MAG TPA: ribonuclease HII [Gemmatimonadales bacterium]|jgi:ribonuclease HII|nr:ribonuclease HII [Gemmatimonadales bacterium]